MSNPRPTLRVALERHSSEPLTVGDWQLRLLTRVARIECRPFGGVVWNMPAAVSAQHVDSADQTFTPIYDVTRFAQVALLLAGLLGALLLRGALKR